MSGELKGPEMPKDSVSFADMLHQQAAEAKAAEPEPEPELDMDIAPVPKEQEPEVAATEVKPKETPEPKPEEGLQSLVDTLMAEEKNAPEPEPEKAPEPPKEIKAEGKPPVNPWEPVVVNTDLSSVNFAFTDKMKEMIDIGEPEDVLQANAQASFAIGAEVLTRTSKAMSDLQERLPNQIMTTAHTAAIFLNVPEMQRLSDAKAVETIQMAGELAKKKLGPLATGDLAGFRITAEIIRSLQEGFKEVANLKVAPAKKTGRGGGGVGVPGARQALKDDPKDKLSSTDKALLNMLPNNRR